MSMKFKTQKIVTGVEKRISTKTNKPYILVNFLNDNGSTFPSMLDNSTEVPTEIKQLDKVNVEFEVIPGKYTQLKTLSLSKA